jgi:dipeptidyl aminopeptidase/acylaminoacyl peptidase
MWFVQVEFMILKEKPTAKINSIVDVLDKVDIKTKFVLIYGTADDISKPKTTIDFYNLAKSKGFNVKLVEVKDAPHLDLDMTSESIEAIVELVEE